MVLPRMAAANRGLGRRPDRSDKGHCAGRQRTTARSSVSQGKMSMRAPVTMSVAVITSLLAAISAVQAQAPEDITAGRSLFLQKGNCQACHGWAGDGRKLDNQMPDGADLRATPI